MEIVRQKNVATIIVFPIVDADGDLVTAAASLDSEIDAWTDGAAPDGFADCTNEATEIGTTGNYYLSLTQTEMNNDYIVVQVKTATAGAKTQVILIRTQVGDPLNNAVTDDGTAINVASGVVEAQVKSMDNNVITSSVIATDAIGAAQIAANAIGASEIADGAIDAGAIASGAITSAKFAAGAIDAAAIAADAIGASELAADAVAEIADAVWDEDIVAAHTTADTAGRSLRTLDAISDRTNNSNLNALLGVPDSAGVDLGEEIADEVLDEALSGHTTAGTAGKKLNDLDTSSVTVTANNDKTGYRLSATGVDDVWDEAQSGHTTAGTFGKYLDAQVSTVGGGSLTAAQVADAVWDELVDDHTADRSFGRKIGLHLPVVSPDIDYKRIKKVVHEEIEALPAPKEPEKVDMRPVIEALESLSAEIRAIDIPKAEKFDLTPLMTKIEATKQAVESIKIPKTDLSEVNTGINDLFDQLSMFSEALTEVKDGQLTRLREFFENDLDKMNKNMEALKEQFESIPYLTLNTRQNERPSNN